MTGEETNAEALRLSDLFWKRVWQKVTRQLEGQSVEGIAGNGAVRVVLSGKQVVMGVSIAPQAASDPAALERLLATAVGDALKKSHSLIAREVKRQLGGSLPLPDDIF